MTTTNALDYASPVIVDTYTRSTNYIRVIFSESVALADGKIPADAMGAFSAYGITIDGVYRSTSTSSKLSTGTASTSVYLHANSVIADDFTASDFAVEDGIFDDAVGIGGNTNRQQTGLTIRDGFVQTPTNIVASPGTTIPEVTFGFVDVPNDDAVGVTKYYIGFAPANSTSSDIVAIYNGIPGDNDAEVADNLVENKQLKEIVATADTDGAPEEIGSALTKTINGDELVDNTEYVPFVVTFDTAGNAFIAVGNAIPNLVVD